MALQALCCGSPYLGVNIASQRRLPETYGIARPPGWQVGGGLAFQSPAAPGGRAAWFACIDSLVARLGTPESQTKVARVGRYLRSYQCDGSRPFTTARGSGFSGQRARPSTPRFSRRARRVSLEIAIFIYIANACCSVPPSASTREPTHWGPQNMLYSIYYIMRMLVKGDREVVGMLAGIFRTQCWPCPLICVQSRQFEVCQRRLPLGAPRLGEWLSTLGGENSVHGGQHRSVRGYCRFLATGPNEIMVLQQLHWMGCGPCGGVCTCVNVGSSGGVQSVYVSNSNRPTTDLHILLQSQEMVF